MENILYGRKGGGIKDFILGLKFNYKNNLKEFYICFIKLFFV